MIKRFLSLVLCLCLLGTASVALADSETQKPDADGNFEGKSVDITAIAKSTAIDKAADVYSVEIVWGDMQFAYGYSSESTTATWNPETHEYDVVEVGTTTTATKGWYMLNEGTALTNAGATELGLTTQDAVLVFNHSNQPVDVAIAIKDVTENDTDGLTAAFTESGNAVAADAENTWALAKGTEGDVYADDGSSVMGTVKITDDMETFADYEKPVTIAKLNVTISKAAASTAEPNT